MKRILLALLLMGSFPGCMYYYKVQTVKPITSREIKMYDSLKKYLIFHQGDSAWHLTDLGYTNEQISGDLSVLPGNHMKYKTTNPEKGNRYIKKKKPYESVVLKEVHLYLTDTLLPQFITGDNIQIAYSSIQKGEVYKKAKGRTTASWLVPGIGVPALAAGIVAIIVVASGSCPFIYTFDGTSYSLIGEIYAGAVYPSLERDDYMMLPGFKAADNQYKLKISNELKECQYTNLADLMFISHPKNSAVYLDKYGCVQTVTDRQSPVSAISLNNNVCTGKIKEKDDDSFLFNEYNSKTSVNQLILTFENKLGSDTGKLIVNAKNSLWAEYTYEKFDELFGSYYQKWDEKQKKIARETQIKQSLDQDIPLSVYLETEQGWEFVDFFPVVGPVIARDIVMAIDLTKVNSKNVRIKLVTGFMFWELGYAAMDFTDNVPVHTTIIKPANAVNEKGINVLSTLYKDDDLRLEQTDKGNEVIVTYNTPPDNSNFAEDSEKTIYLHSKGYYEKITDYHGKPQWAHLMTLKHSHSFSEFSLKEYEKMFKSATLTMKE